MSNPVVVGIVDKQPCAVSFAVHQARSTQSPLRVVHSTAVPGFAALKEPGQAGQAVLDDARHVIEGVAPELEVEYVLTGEEPIQALEQATQSARLLVLGADDVPWFDRLLRTKVSGHLALHASCPVVVVPELSYAGTYEGDIVLTVGGDTFAEGPIRFAFEQANAGDAVLHVVHTTVPGTGTADSGKIRADLVEAMVRWREAFPDVMVLTAVAVGDPKETIARASGSAALVIIGRPPRQAAPFTAARALATQVLRRAHCPVAVVPATYQGA